MKLVQICNSDGAVYIFRKPIIRSVLSLGHTVVAICSESWFFRKLTDMGVRPIHLEFARHSIAPLGNLILLVRLFLLVRNERPDLVHNFTHKPAIYGTLVAGVLGVKKIFVTITGLGNLFIYDDLRSLALRQLLILQYRIALRFATRVFFQNPDDLAYFVSLKIVDPKQAVLTHGSGIDLDEYPAPSPAEVSRARNVLADELGIDLSDKLLVMFPARGVPEKGFFEFYEAARIVTGERPGKYVFIHLGLVDMEAARHLSLDGIEAFAAYSNVRYLGFKENIQEYMRAVDVVALPSYREGVPRSLIEALALGKVVITSNVPGCREVLVDHWNGFLCEPCSAVSLAEKISMVDDMLCKLAKSRSREYCQEKFDAKWLVDLTLRHYALEEQ